MDPREPSRTAFAAAGYRAAHQVLDGARLFPDPYALPILGWTPEAVTEHAETLNAQRGMRFFVVARSVIAERALKAAVEDRGVTQLVVLGAGLDTFAYRNPFPALTVFEVDHPATQAWKRDRLAQARIAIPPSLVYASVDFETENLAERLAASGLDSDARTVFLWLGVVPYLTREAIFATLAAIAVHPGGAEVFFDYGEPREALSDEAAAAHADRAARVASIGEPFLSFFDPAALSAELTALGLPQQEDLTVPQMLQRLLGPLAPASSRTGGHVMHAMTTPAP